MEKYLPILKNSSFFKGLTDDEILSILHCVEATTVSKERDSYIFRAADSTEVMGLVVSGCVLVIQEDLWGHRNILSKCHAGDFFGLPYYRSATRPCRARPEVRASYMLWTLLFSQIIRFPF